jgi:hypothetical protein
MDTKKMTKEKILHLAEQTKHYTELFIKQCDSWLSEEEGIRNMEKRIRERREKEKEKLR